MGKDKNYRTENKSGVGLEAGVRLCVRHRYMDTRFLSNTTPTQYGLMIYLIDPFTSNAPEFHETLVT